MKICDKCGDNKLVVSVTITPHPEFDLCEKCRHDVMLFINNSNNRWKGNENSNN